MHRIARIVVAIAIFVASFPLSLLAMERGFGLAAALTVPTCCLGFWLSIASTRRAKRIGWFAFSSTCVALLPICPWWQRQIEGALRGVQNIIRGSQPTWLYSACETLALLVLILLPWAVGCVFGMLSARLVKKLIPSSIDNEVCSSEYQFTLRGMLTSIMVLAFLTAWLSGTVRQWQTRETTNQATFLEQFKRSFTSGDVTLLANPEIVEDHTIVKRSQNASGISEYRLTAPITKQGRELWAVWTFLCDEAYPGTVSKFGYAEAPTQIGLPPPPFPLTEYLREPIYKMVDGEPHMPTIARILNAPTVSKAGDTITIVAETDRFLECTLIISPFHAVRMPPTTIIAPENGVVRWIINLDPAYNGTYIEYEFQARTNPLYRAKMANGTVTLESKNGNEPTVAPKPPKNGF